MVPSSVMSPTACLPQVEGRMALGKGEEEKSVERRGGKETGLCPSPEGSELHVPMDWTVLCPSSEVGKGY